MPIVDYISHQNATLQYCLNDGQTEPDGAAYTNYHVNDGSPVNKGPDYHSLASFSTTLLTHSTREDSMPWGCDPEFSSLPHLDMTNFEVVSDFDGRKKVIPWP